MSTRKSLNNQYFMFSFFKLIIILSFIILVILPTIFIAIYVLMNWNEVFKELFENPLIGSENWYQIERALLISFKIASFVVLFDIVIGLPMAYTLSRKKFFGINVIKDLVTLPLIVPTSGFGFATLITWTTGTWLFKILGLNSGLINLNDYVPFINIPFLIFLVHVALTFPYIVLPLESRLKELDPTYEYASRTLGASSLTTFRKVIFPLVVPALFSGSILAFARSLGETGATIVVAGVTTTAPIAIVRWVHEFKFSAGAFLGFLLVILTWLIILPLEFYVSKEKSLKTLSMLSIFSKIEKSILRIENVISKKMTSIKDFISLAFLFIIVILPILTVLSSLIAYWNFDPYTGKPEGGAIYQLFGPQNYFAQLLRATLVSFIVAFISTYISTCLSIPLVYIIKKSFYGWFIRLLLKVPLVVPTSALGLSILMLWGPKFLNLLKPGIWLIILTHIVFSVPVIVESIIGVYERSGIELYEECARTLGANPYDVAETISLPLLKRGILAGAILSFTHSLGETGATFIVMGKDITIPTLVVNIVEALAIPAALFSSMYILAISLLLLGIFRFIVKE
ncbi:MAG: ABC transporter permease subunit [Candidatus Bathyarchaeia archaeon]